MRRTIRNRVGTIAGMDASEHQQIEEQIRLEGRRAALALADYPQLAQDIHDLVASDYPIESRDELDDWYAIGGVDDYQADSESREHRRTRRMCELKLALDELVPPGY